MVFRMYMLKIYFNIQKYALKIAALNFYQNVSEALRYIQKVLGVSIPVCLFQCDAIVVAKVIQFTRNLDKHLCFM